MPVVLSSKLTFRRFGRTHHLKLDTAADLPGVLELDEALWVATSMPTHSIQCNMELMQLIDKNHDGRIHTEEIKEAIDWLLKNLRDKSGIDHASDTLELAAINVDHDQGQAILESCKKMLVDLGMPDSHRITLDQIQKVRANVEAETVSEAGVVLPEAAGDDDTRQFLSDIVASLGGTDHPSNQPGVSQVVLDQFLEQVKVYLDWLSLADATATGDGSYQPVSQQTSDTNLWPLGDETERAYAIVDDLDHKLDQFFDQCQVLAIDQRLSDQMRLGDKDIQTTNIADPKAIKQLLARASLARPVCDGVLDFSNPINPWYAQRVAALQTQVLEPLLGSSFTGRLTSDQWDSVKERFLSFACWREAKPPDAVAVLDETKLQGYLEASFCQKASQLIQSSHKTAFKLKNIRLAQKLVLYQSNLLTLVNNFVSFPYLYDATTRAMFEAGTLVMDSRRFDLAIRVQDVNQHAKVAQSSSMLVLYARVNDLSGDFIVAVPVTSGGKGNLCVGKRGVFHDTQGQISDAQIIKTIDNPVSIGEAIFAPFKRIGELVGQKVDQMTSSAETQLDSTAQQALTRVTTGESAPTSPKPIQSSPSIGAGSMLAGGGIAMAAVGSSLAYVSKIIVEFPVAVGIGLCGAVLAVVIPNAILAYVRLKKQDLSAILEGSGWAINARMRLTYQQRRHFTRKPAYPLSVKGIGVIGWMLTAACIMGAAAVYGWWVMQSST